MADTAITTERKANTTDDAGLPKVSNSMRASWKKCQRTVYYRYVAGIECKQHSNTARIVGSSYHHGLELWRKAGNTQKHEQVLEIINLVCSQLTEELKAKGFEDKAELEAARMAAYLHGYFCRYADDAIMIPGIGAELSIEGEHDIGVLDGLHFDEATKIATLVEDKTRGDLADERAVALGIDEQILLYADMLKRSPNPPSILRVLYREMLKTRTKPNKGESVEQYGQRVLGIYTNPGKLKELYREIAVVVDWLEVEAYARERHDIDAMIRSKLLTQHMINGFTRNSNECIGPYGACEYLELCAHQRAISSYAKAYKPNSKQPLDNGAMRKRMFGEAVVAPPVQPQNSKKDWWEDE